MQRILPYTGLQIELRAGVDVIAKMKQNPRFLLTFTYTRLVWSLGVHLRTNPGKIPVFSACYSFALLAASSANYF